MPALPGDLPIDPNSVSGTELAERLNRILPDVANAVTGAGTSFVPSGTIAANNVQGAIQELDSEKVAKSGDTMTGDLTFSGDGRRIRGDFSNGTVANRLLFQTSSLNFGSLVGAIPNGSARTSGFYAYNNPTPDAASLLAISINDATSVISSTKTGAGAYLPLSFATGGQEWLNIGINGVAEFKQYINNKGFLQFLDAGTKNQAIVFKQTDGSSPTVAQMYRNVMTGVLALDLSGNNGDAGGTFVWDLNSSFTCRKPNPAENYSYIQLLPQGNLFLDRILSGTNLQIESPANVSFSAGGSVRATVVQDGNFRVANLAGSGNRALYSTADGSLTNNSSDESLKESVKGLTQGLDAVMAMRPISYHWIDKEKRGAQKEIGFIAQDMLKIVPEVVGTNSDETLSLDYAKLVAVMAKAIQELKAEVDDLRSKITP